MEQKPNPRARSWLLGLGSALITLGSVLNVVDYFLPGSIALSLGSGIVFAEIWRGRKTFGGTRRVVGTYTIVALGVAAFGVGVYFSLTRL